MRYARIPGLVAIAIAALTAFVGVSPASAEQFKSNSSPVMIFGEDTGNHKFTVDSQAVTCTNVVFEKASLSTPANTVPGVTASYNGCTAFGFAGATVNMGNCTYEFLQPNANTGRWAIHCPENSQITIHASAAGSECTVSIHEEGNTFIEHYLPTNFGLLLRLSITGNKIRVTKTKDTLFCPLSGTGETNNATYNGPIDLSGTGGVGISVS